jgi:hypothetical protein
MALRISNPISVWSGPHPMLEGGSAARPHKIFACAEVPASRLGTKMTIAGGVGMPLLHRHFPQEMINPGQVLAALLTAEAGG